MKLLTVSLLTSLVTSAIAADCSVPAESLPSDLLHVYWDARNQMCSNSNCAWQQDCQVQTSASNGNAKISVTLKRSASAEASGFKNCYDGTNDIINQCVYGTHYMNGQWQYGGETYTLESTFEGTSAPPAPPAPPAPSAPPTPSAPPAPPAQYNFDIWADQQLATAPNGGFSPHQEFIPCFIVRISDSATGTTIGGANSESSDDTRCAQMIKIPKGSVRVHLKFTEISCDRAVYIEGSDYKFCTDGDGYTAHFPGLIQDGKEGWCRLENVSGNAAVGHYKCHISF